MSQTNHKTALLLRFGIGLMIIWLAFQVANRFQFRLDMTEEKRYSISDATKNLLGRLEGDVVIEVYLAGELPSSFIRFQKGIRETLEEFAIYSTVSFDVRFVDPTQAQSTQARNQFFQGLINQGIQPTNLSYSKDGQNTQKMIFPGAIVTYQGRELAVNLLKGSRAGNRDEIINQSIEGLEYEFANTIQQLASSGRKRIGLVTGHDEPDSTLLGGLTNLVLSKYDLFRVNLPEKTTPLVGYDLLLITKPSAEFTDNEKFLLDQYVMKGGRLAFFMDVLSINIDSALMSSSVAIPVKTNLEDLLFKYGVRINQNYVADLNAGQLPVITGNIGDQPQITMLDWPYFPVITNYGTHPVVRNMDAVMLKMASSIDTVKAPGVNKYPLFSSSANSKVIGYPVEVSLNDLRGTLRPEAFQAGPQVMGYLLEGNFTSLYKNRFAPPAFRNVDKIDDGAKSKIVVIADGNIITNELNPENGRPLPLGTMPYSQSSYGNENLVKNIIDYLVDEDGLIQTRSKEVKIRPLNKVKVRVEKVQWQIINIVMPIVLLILFGLVKVYLRKRSNKF